MKKIGFIIIVLILVAVIGYFGYNYFATVKKSSNGSYDSSSGKYDITTYKISSSDVDENDLASAVELCAKKGITLSDFQKLNGTRANFTLGENIYLPKYN